MEQFILFGDSIIQQSGVGSFGPTLSNAYARRLDVINRGLSGYNTTQALKVLPKIIPPPQHAKVRFMLIFFGANDARLPSTPGGPDQHVPLEQYKSNLKKIATHPCVQAHQRIRIILVTPPPVDERKLVEADQQKYPEIGSMLRRTAKTTASYAQAVRDLGAELQFPILDIWNAMIRAAGTSIGSLDDDCLPGSQQAPKSEVLQSYLHDGLHFSLPAYKLLYEELMSVIEEKWPDQLPENLPFVLPRWDDEQAWKAEDPQEARTML